MDKNITNTTRPQSFMVKLGLFFALCFGVGTAFYHVVEDFTLVDSIYMTAMTLTTVGYGDLVPQTDVDKLFTSVYAFLGVVTFLGFAAALFEAAISRHKRKFW